MRFVELCSIALVCCGQGSEAARPPSVRPDARAHDDPVEASDRELVDEADWFLGMIVARETVDLSSTEGGVLVRLERGLGDAVVAGETVAEIGNGALGHELDGDRAEAASARAGAAAARARSDLAREHAARSDSLEGAIADQAVHDARFMERVTRSEAGAAQAQARAQRAREARTRARLNALSVRAPFDGRVAVHYAAPGSFVSAGAPIVRVVSDAILVRFAVPASVELAPGAALELEAHDGTRRFARTTVRRVAPSVDLAGMRLAETDIVTPLEGIGAGQLVRVSRVGAPP